MDEIHDRLHDELLVVDLVVVKPVIGCLSLESPGRHLVAGHRHSGCAIA